MSEVLDRAQRVVPVFSGQRLKAARELQGLTQKRVAEAVGITPSALSQAERDSSKPSASTLVRLADTLEVTVEAFARRPAVHTELNPQFRHLRRTPQREQKRALRLVEATGAVLKVLERRVDLPEAFHLEVDPTSSIETVAEAIEEIASDARSFLGLRPHEPLDLSMGLVRLLEDSGVVVVRDPETDENIDAYSAVVDRQPIVVLDGRETDWDRDNFNLAHELGHLIMHRASTQRPGTKSAEAQAHRFAGAFLAPRKGIEGEVPSGLDWGKYLELKLRWGMSMAALVHRAHDMGLIADTTYSRAMKQRSAYGWRRVEPGRDAWPLAKPTLLAEAAITAGLEPDQIADVAGLPPRVVKRVLGPGPRPKIRG